MPRSGLHCAPQASRGEKLAGGLQTSSQNKPGEPFFVGPSDGRILRNLRPSPGVLSWCHRNLETMISVRSMMQLLILVVSTALAGCASGQGSAAGLAAGVADAVPHWMGGMPPDVPPRPGTPEYEAWQAERAKEAARPKGGASQAN